MAFPPAPSPALGKGKPSATGPKPPPAKPKGKLPPGATRKPLLRALLIASGEDSIPPGIGDDVDVVNADDLDEQTLASLQTAAEPAGSLGAVQDARQSGDAEDALAEEQGEGEDDPDSPPPGAGPEGAEDEGDDEPLGLKGAGGDEPQEGAVPGQGDGAEPGPPEDEAPPSSSIPPSPPDEEVDEELAGQEGDPGEDPSIALGRMGHEAQAFEEMSTKLGDRVLGALATQSPADAQGLGLQGKRQEVHEAMVEVEDAAKQVYAATEAGDLVAGTKALQDMRQSHDVIKQVAVALGLAGDEQDPGASPDLGAAGGAPPGEDDEGLGAWAASKKQAQVPPPPGN